MRCYSHLPPIGGKTEQVIDPESASPLFAGGTADATPVAPCAVAREFLAAAFC